ncbi:MAG: hypothetical protein BWK73_12940 [Thiothrix lacustris]|uniref:Uncharacterized protein n=1 Tax=Thiothrix lacustris TaxID=525917 RepID=A0A1Y1QT10_9GAMM|nr:MAG: hypothetical protein BWK73_12940 [Thiothrix lacustris]
MKILICPTCLISLSLLSFSPVAFTANAPVAASADITTDAMLTTNESVCIADTWGKTISLVSDYTNATNVLVFPHYFHQSFDDYTSTETDSIITVYPDCRISIQSFDDKTRHDVNLQRKPLRYEVIDNGDGSYQFKSQEFNTLLVFPQNSTTSFHVTHLDTPVREIIEGTREQPDPVETKIRTLEQAGQLRILRVMESFPLRFEVEGSAEVIRQVRSE